MKKQVLLFVAAILTLASCNQQQNFNINVNLANADGQTVYLQKAGQTLDSAVIYNWDAVFKTPVCDDNEMYAIMLKGWRRPFSFFTDHQDMTLEGDAQNPNAIVVKGSESQARLDAFNKSYNELETKLEADGTSQADAEEILKMHCFDCLGQSHRPCGALCDVSLQVGLRSLRIAHYDRQHSSCG
jgi:hypothetical protein